MASTPEGDVEIKGDVQKLNTTVVFDLETDISVKLFELLQTLNVAQPVTGDLEAAIKISGSVLNPDLKCKLVYNGGNIYGVDVGKANADITTKGRGLASDQISANTVITATVNTVDYEDILQQVTLDIKTGLSFQDKVLKAEQIEIVSGNDKIETAGSYNFKTHEVNGVLKGLVPELSVLSALLHGSLELLADISGTTDKPVFTGKLNLNNIQYKEYNINTGLVELDLDPEGLCRLNTLSLTRQDMRLHGNGQIQLFEKGFTLHDKMDTGLSLFLENIDLFEIDSAIPLHGELNGNLTAQGPLRDVQASLKVNGQDLYLYESSIGNLETQCNYKNGIVSITNMGLSRESTELAANGWISLLEPGSLSLIEDPEIIFNISGENCQVSTFYPDASGNISFKSLLNGTLNAPGGNLELSGRDINWYQSFESIDAKINLDQNILTLKNLNLQVVPEEGITAEGRIDLSGGKYNVSVRSTPIMVGHVTLLEDSEVPGGFISTTLSGEGSFDNPNLNADIDLTGLNFKETALPDVQINCSLEDTRIEVAARGGLDFKGMLDIASKDFSARFNLNDMALSPVFRILDKEGFSGKITGLVQASGNLDKYLDSAGAMEIDHASVYYLDKGLFEVNNLVASYEDRTLTLPENRINFAEGGLLTFKGEGRYPEKLIFDLNGRIPAVMLHLISEEWPQMGGDILVAGGAKGKWENPDLKLDLELSKISIDLPMLDQEVKNLNGKIRMSSGAVEFDKLEGYLEDGLFGMDGRVDLDNLSPEKFSIHIFAQTLPIQVPDALSAIVSADLNLTGRPEKSELKGDVGLIEGIYFRDFNLSLFDAIRLPQKKVPAADQGKDNPFLANMNLSVQVYHRNPFEIENNLLAASIIPDLKIRGTALQPLLQGRVRTESGIVYFRNQEFNISQGTMDFVNPYKNDPEIEINSDVQIRDWDIKLYLSGPVDNLNFSFTSISIR